MKRFAYLEAADVPQAAKLAAEEGTAVRAGGVDLTDMQKEHLTEPDRVVSILRAKGSDGADLRTIRADGNKIVIGALATLAQVARDPLLNERARAVARAAGESASPQIRNQATAAGNLLQRPRCWYFRNELLLCARKGGPECLAHDGENRFHAIFGNEHCAIVHPSNLAPALMLFDAIVKTVKADGSKRELPVSKLFVTPEVDISRENCLEKGEIVEAIVVPIHEGGAASRFDLIREKQAYDWPLLAAAVRLEMSGTTGTVNAARIVLGAVCPVPLRREMAEAALVGKKLDEKTAAAAAAVAFEGATPLAQNGYKIPAGTALLTRAILAAAGR